MCKKLMFLISIVALLGLVNIVSADDIVWTNAVGDREWSEPGNWDPCQVPGSDDKAIIDPPAVVGPNIHSGDAIEVEEIEGPVWDEDGDLTVDVTGGSITTEEWKIGDADGTGTLNVSGNGYVDITSDEGWDLRSSAVINVTDDGHIFSDEKQECDAGHTLNISGNGLVEIKEIEWKEGGFINISENGTLLCFDDRFRYNDDEDGYITLTDNAQLLVPEDDIRIGDNGGTWTELIIQDNALVAVDGELEFGDDGSGIVDVQGGTLDVGDDVTLVARRGEDQDQTFSVSGGLAMTGDIRLQWDDDDGETARLNVSAGELYCGNIRMCDGPGEVWLNMTGGYVEVDGSIEAPTNDEGGFVTINLNGGTIVAEELEHEDDTWFMDISLGLMILEENVVDDLEDDVKDGKIQAYGGCGGRGKVMIEYDEPNDVTLLYAIEDLEKAWNPSPGCDEEDVTLVPGWKVGPVTFPAVELSWSPGDSAVAHDVYFGDDKDLVAARDASTYRGQQGGTIHMTDPLPLAEKEYYWAIDEVGGSTGDVWAFTTTNYRIVDNFDNPYVDTNDLRLTWKDGQGRGNDSGSEVFLETGIVHSGNKSMKFTYDNAGSTDPCLQCYSEVKNVMKKGHFEWTAAGEKQLVLWFYGDPGNDVEQMYLALDDGDDLAPAGVVAYGAYNDQAAEDIQNAEWQPWHLSLADFAALSVDISFIKKLYIGFGDRDNPVCGGSGVVYFDTIRLYPATCRLEMSPLKTDLDEDCDSDMWDLDIWLDEWMTDDR